MLVSQIINAYVLNLFRDLAFKISGPNPLMPLPNKTTSISAFTPELQAAIYLLKEEIRNEETIFKTPPETKIKNDRLFATHVYNHGIIAPVYKALKQGHFFEVDDKTLQHMKLHRVQYHFNSQKQVLALHKLSELLRNAEIPFICLKGPVLSQSLLDNTTDRSSNDLDILVDFHDLNALHNVLEKAGHRRIFPAHELTPIQTKVFYARDCVAKYHIDGILLEVHWRLFENPHLLDHPFDSLLENSQPVSIEGRTFRQLGQTDLLLYLVAHGAKHQWVQLKWLYDIHLFLQNTTYDYHEIESQAAQNGLFDVLQASISLCVQLFGTKTDLPHSALRLLNKRQRILSNAFLRSIEETTPPLRQPAKLINARIFLRQLYLKSHWRYRSRLLSRWLFNTQDWQTCPLPDYLFPLYLLIRPYLWLKRKKNPATER